MHVYQKKIRSALCNFIRQDWPALPGRSNHIHCGVLVPILADPDWTCILTQRPTTLRHHKGEICFPGGKRDINDCSLESTALREAKEELALEGGEIMGQLSSVPLYTSDYRLVPFLGLFPQHVDINPNRAEVSAVLKISLKKLLALPFWDGMPFSLAEKSYISPIFLPQKIGIDIEQPIFGGTAHVLYEVLQLIAHALNTTTPQLRATFDQFPFVQSTS